MIKFTYILSTTLIAVILNIVLSLVLSQYATSEEKKPPNGADNLSLKGQFMHMMSHHNQVLLTSSLIIAVVVLLSHIIAFFVDLIF